MDRRIVYGLLALLLLLPTHLSAQNELRTVKSYVKAGNKLDEAEKLMDQCLAQEEHKRDAEYYLMAFEVQKKINETENEKAFLKQSYDTVRLFNSIKKMYDYLIRLDSVDATPNEKGKVSPKYRKKSCKELLNYRQNLLTAGKYFYRNQNYSNAYTFLTTYMDCSEQPLFESEASKFDVSEYPRVSYYAAACGYNLKQPEWFFAHSELAMQDTTNASVVQEYASELYQLMPDSTKWIETLKDGVFRFPASPYFFAHLMDYYNATERYNEALNFASSMLEMDSTAFHLYAKGLILYNMQNYAECKELCNAALAKDSLYADAYFTLGSCWCNEADEIRKVISGKQSAKQVRERRERMKGYYESALPYMEKYRALRPDERKWAPVLYDIYLNLNKGQEFEEIDAIINSK